MRFEGELQRLRRIGHPLAAKWEGAFPPYRWVQNNLGFLSQPVVIGLGSDFGLYLGCTAEAMKTAAEEKMLATVLRNPQVHEVGNGIYAIARQYQLNVPVTLCHSGVQVAEMRDGDVLWDLHAEPRVHQLVHRRQVTELARALRELEFLLHDGNNAIFTVSPTLPSALSELSPKIQAWDLSAVRNAALKAMYTSYGHRFLNEGAETYTPVATRDIKVAFGVL